MDAAEMLGQTYDKDGSLRYPDNSGTSRYIPEMATDQHQPQELPLAQHQSFALPPYELPTRRDHHELSS